MTLLKSIIDSAYFRPYFHKGIYQLDSENHDNVKNCDVITVEKVNMTQIVLQLIKRDKKMIYLSAPDTQLIDISTSNTTDIKTKIIQK